MQLPGLVRQSDDFRSWLIHAACDRLTKAGQRERCFYRLTAEGRRVLRGQRETWLAYVDAVNAVMGTGGA